MSDSNIGTTHLSDKASSLINAIREDLLNNNIDASYSSHARVHYKYDEDSSANSSGLITDYVSLFSQLLSLYNNESYFNTVVYFDEVTKKKFCIEAIKDPMGLLQNRLLESEVSVTETVKGTTRQYNYNSVRGYIYLISSNLVSYLEYLLLDTGINSPRDVTIRFKNSEVVIAIHYL